MPNMKNSFFEEVQADKDLATRLADKRSKIERILTAMKQQAAKVDFGTPPTVQVSSFARPGLTSLDPGKTILDSFLTAAEQGNALLLLVPSFI